MVKKGATPNKNRVKRRGKRSICQRLRRQKEKQITQSLLNEEQRMLQAQTISQSGSPENRGDNFLGEIENEETVLPEESTETSVPLSIPNIGIKEEPIDIDENPLPSTSRTREEYALPEPDRTLAGEAISVVKREKASNGNDKDGEVGQSEKGGEDDSNETKDPFDAYGENLAVGSTPVLGEVFSVAEQLKKKKVIHTPIDGVYVYGQSKKASISMKAKDRVCVYGQPKAKTKDRFDVYGEYIAAKLRNLDWNSCAYVRRAIGDIISMAEVGKFKNRELLERQFNLQS